MTNKNFVKTNGTYGAYVGHRPVFTRQAAIEIYKLFLDDVYNSLDIGGARALAEVEEDLIKIGFTWEELEEIELDFLKNL